MNVDVSIVVPTFREVENLAELVERIRDALANRVESYEIIIVDDNSNDGTIELCAKLKETHPLRLETRKKDRGLASAVIRGLEIAGGEFLVVMDADMSHPAEVIYDLVEAVRTGADMAIGSRYVAGASTDDRWGLIRWCNSRIATLLARPLTEIKDPMAGFFAIRKSTATSPNLEPIGYKIALELLVKCNCRFVTEVPIHFSDRMRGKSKLNLKEQWNYITHLKRLYVFRLSKALVNDWLPNQSLKRKVGRPMTTR